MLRNDIILGYLISVLNEHVDELYYVSQHGPSEHYYQIVDNILFCINQQLMDECFETLNITEKHWVIREIENLIHSFDRTAL